MNQSGDGSWTGHGVREPYVKRNLRALAGRADEEQHCNRSQAARENRSPPESLDGHDAYHFESAGNAGCRLVKETDGSVTCRGSDEEKEHYAEHKAPVAYAVGDEGLLSGVSGFLPVDVITDQKVRAESDTFPTHKHQQKVISQNKGQH